MIGCAIYVCDFFVSSIKLDIFVHLSLHLKCLCAGDLSFLAFVTLLLIVSCGIVMASNGESSVRIRRFERADQSEVSAFYRTAFSTYTKENTIPEVVGLSSWFISDKLKEGGDMSDVCQLYTENEDKRKCFWVAVELETNKVVGCVGAIPSTEFDPNEYMELVRMGVDPTFRKAKIGSRLLRQVEEWGIENSCKYVNLSTLDGMLPACGFYKSNGYTVDHIVPLEPEKIVSAEFLAGNVVNVVHFVKCLRSDG